MSGPVNPPSVREWVRRAEHDLRNAEYTLTLMDDCPFDTVCFHAQQCAEKYIKALLLIRGVVFPFSHDLEELVQLLPSSDQTLIVGTRAEVLNPYTVQGRYPGPWDPLERPEAEAAVQIDRDVRDVIRSLLPKGAL